MRDNPYDAHGRVWLSITNKTYTPEQNGIDMQEVTGKNAGRLSSQELTPRRRRPTRRGPEPDSSQDPADRPLPYPVPQAEQLALDAPIPPPRVLPGQLPHYYAHLAGDRPPAGSDAGCCMSACRRAGSGRDKRVTGTGEPLRSCG
jgi:hypothetical protein